MLIQRLPPLYCLSFLLIREILLTWIFSPSLCITHNVRELLQRIFIIDIYIHLFFFFSRFFSLLLPSTTSSTHLRFDVYLHLSLLLSFSRSHFFSCFCSYYVERSRRRRKKKTSSKRYSPSSIDTVRCISRIIIGKELSSLSLIVRVCVFLSF